ncbi:AAA family ATPase [Methylocella sp.]|uniref:AAA family ATPase n=1 Tax=Methylocella sp. TaxID=1978226 RepID=UPI00378378A0
MSTASAPAPRGFAQESLSSADQAAAERLAARLGELRGFLETHLIGASDLVERLLVALLADGHVLIEGAPGLAKTRAAKLLADGLDAPLARVQCTPDLMPADITGASVWRPDRGVFEFIPGPVFHSLVLVDEINRAPPKVQSALLEAMAERQTTAAGVTRRLPDPFMVVATQNPIEHEGTFPLPEAQLDRFMLHAEVKAPDAAAERRILDLVEDEDACGPPAPPRVLTAEEIVAARRAAGGVYLAPAVKDYIVRLASALRGAGGFSGAGKVEHPPSPRGAFLLGRDHAGPQDVAALAVDTLSHRLILTWRALAEGATPRGVVLALLDEIDPV